MTWSFALSTCNNSLLKWVTYCLNDSPFAWRMLRRWQVGFLCLCSPMKWRTKPLLSYSKFAIVPGVILLNQTLAMPFGVVGKVLHVTSFRVICKCIKVLNDLMWSKGSFEPSYDLSWGSWNFGGRGRFNTSMVNGEFVLRIILYKFSMVLSFTVLLSSSISLFILWSSFSILDEFSFDTFVLLLIWLSDSSLLLFPSILRGCSSSFWFLVVRSCSLFWDSATLRSSSFWQVNYAILTMRAWICCAACSRSVLHCENLFCQLV